MPQIVAVRLAGGAQHEHIDRCVVTDNLSSTMSSTDAIVRSIEQGVKFFTRDYKYEVADVRVYPLNGHKYLRTVKDGKWADNLLFLPRLG